MERLEKEERRLLNEKELLDVHGGRSDGQGRFVAACGVFGCNWSSEEQRDEAKMRDLMKAHTDATGHDQFTVIENVMA